MKKVVGKFKIVKTNQKPILKSGKYRSRINANMLKNLKMKKQESGSRIKELTPELTEGPK